MIYKMELSDSVDTMIIPLLEVPIIDNDITGLADNTTIDGNVFRDYLWLKKQYVQKWSIMCQAEYEQLRGFWTRQFGNAEVPFYRLFYGDNVYEDKTGATTDGYLQINNDAPLESPLTLTKLTGNAEQKTLSGKNLTHNTLIAQPTTYAGNVVVSPNDDGTVSLNGTATSSVWVNIDNIVLPEGANIAHIGSTTQSTTAGGYTFSVRVENGDINFAYNGTNHYVSIYLWSGQTYTNAKVYIQIEAGSQATAWEQFCGGTPSPNPDYPQTVNVVTGEQKVRITGKNMFAGGNADYAGAQAYIGYGNATYTLTDGAYNMADRFGSIAFEYDQLVEGRQYTISFDVIANAQFSARVGVNVYNGSPTEGRVSYEYTAKTTSQRISWAFTAQAENRIAFNSGTTAGANITISNIQLEDSEAATTYEAYHGQSYEINLGKNIWNTNNAQAFVDAVNVSAVANLTTYDNKECVYWSASAGYGSYDTKNLTLNVEFQENTQYTLSWDTYPTSTFSLLCFEYTDGTTSGAATTLEAGTWHHLSITSTAGKTVKNIHPAYNGGAVYVDINSVQLEVGTQATSYSAYKTPIELCKISTYQDYIWNDDGTWKIHKETNKVVLDGTEAIWGTYAYGTNSYQAVILGIAQTPYWVPLAVADRFYGIPYNDRATTAGECLLYADGGVANRLVVRNTTWASLADFQTWLGTHNTTVYYALATPTDTEITDSGLIAQLNHIYSLYGGVNNLWLIPSAGAQGEMEVQYRLNYEQETDIVPKTPVVLTLTDGGVINPCGCRENIQLTMRETTQGNSES